MDPNQMNHMAGAIAGMMGAIMLVAVIIAAFVIFLFWRILVKAGLAGPFALLALIGPLGVLIILCILAFSEWRVAPIPPLAYYPPSYPPPPPGYPPATPPSV